MYTRVHALIVKSAASLLPAELKYELNTVVTEGEYAGKTYLELIMLGSKLEDSTSIPGPLPDPGLQDIPEGIFEGKYKPWMEHFWNTSLKEGKGLVISAEYLGEIIGGATGFVVGGPLGAYMGSCVGGAIADNFNLAEYRSAVDRAEAYWSQWVINQYKNGNKVEAYINLGRVCHLIADVATPAHVHNDPHPGKQYFEDIEDLKFDDDDYEDYTAEIVDQNNNNLPSKWNVSSTDKIVYNPKWDIKRHFREMAEITRLYDSDDVDGKGQGHPYHWDHWYDSAINILPIDRDIQGDLTDYACDCIACDLIPASIQFTTGIMCMFFQEINFRFKLNTIEVQLTKIKVLDDTDPFGKGEIYLKAWIEGTPAEQYGEYDLGSGNSKTLKKAYFSAVLEDEDSPVTFFAKAYDDDSTYFWDDSESLGKIEFVINPKTISSSGEKYTVESTGGDGKFELYLTVRKYESGYSEKEVKHLIKNKRKFSDSANFLKKSKFNLYKRPPILVNMETLCKHGSSGKKKPQKCGHWQKIDDTKKLEFSMYEYELFEDLEGNTMLKEIVKKKYGEDSPQYKKVKDLKEFKSQCSCLKDGK